MVTKMGFSVYIDEGYLRYLKEELERSQRECMKLKAEATK